MDKDNLEQLFWKLNGDFDTEEPEDGHRERFLAKLELAPTILPLGKNKMKWWIPVSIAASLLLLLSLAFNIKYLSPTLEQQVSRISPEIANSQYYFASLIEVQVKNLQNESSPETDKMISDTMTQLRALENDYNQMKQDLLNGGNSKLILSAMIGNFQTRIDLLNETLVRIEKMKTLKENKNENIIT